MTTTPKSFIVALFTAAPLSIMPLLTQSERLDLVDLYEANMQAQVQNRFGGMTELTALSDTLIALRMTEVSTLEMRLRPDSIIELRHSVALPEYIKTTTRYFTTDWQKVKIDNAPQKSSKQK